MARVNNGAMKNVGFEASLSYDWLRHGDWRLNTTLTASFNKNTIEEVGYTPSSASDMLTDPYNNYLQGDAYGTVYAYRYAGLDANGDPSVYNENGEVGEQCQCGQHRRSRGQRTAYAQMARRTEH